MILRGALLQAGVLRTECKCREPKAGTERPAAVTQVRGEGARDQASRNEHF